MTMDTDAAAQTTEANATRRIKLVLSIIEPGKETYHELMVGKRTYYIGHGEKGLKTILDRHVDEGDHAVIHHFYDLVIRRSGADQTFVDWEIKDRGMRGLQITEDGETELHHNAIMYLFG